MLVEALVETALESGLIVGFVGAVEYLLVRYLPGTKVEKFSEVARLALWTAAVFGSGSATAGPKRWLEKSQLFNIDVPIGKDWWVKMSLSCALSLFLVDVVDRPHGYLFFIPLFSIFPFFWVASLCWFCFVSCFVRVPARRCSCISQVLHDSSRLFLWFQVFLSPPLSTPPPPPRVLFMLLALLRRYANLRKPWFNPPNWVFPIMWIPLKILQVCFTAERWRWGGLCRATRGRGTDASAQSSWLKSVSML